MMRMKMYLIVFMCLVLSITALDCSFDKRDVEVPISAINSTVQIDCVWKTSALSGSSGFLLGVIVYDPVAQCHMLSARVSATSSASKESNCIPFSGFEDWCNKYLLNATEVTKANNWIRTSVKLPVQSLLHYNLTYNGTSHIRFYWRPQFYGQDNNKGGSQCIVQVHISGPAGKSVEPNSTPGPTKATPTEGTNSSASPISTARPKSDDVASKGSTTKKVVIPLAVALSVLLFLIMVSYGMVWYCKKTGRCQRCSQLRSPSSVLENPMPFCGSNNENGSTEV